MDEITKIKLKPSKNLTQDRSDPNPKKQIEELKESKAKATYANVENWYEGLKEHVIPAYMFSLENDEGEAIIANYEAKMVKFKGRVLTEKEKELLERVAEKIDKSAKENIQNATNEGFFVRLSTRSAKDGMLFAQKTFDAVNSKVEEQKKKTASDHVSDNDKLAIIFTEFIQQLVVKSGKEAVELLSQSHRFFFASFFS